MTPAEKLAKKLSRPTTPPAPPGRRTRWRCRVRDLRESLGLSLKDVAAAIPMSQGVLSRIERGTDPLLTSATDLCRFFGRTVDELWEPLKTQTSPPRTDDEP